jgi:hypothetical protein
VDTAAVDIPGRTRAAAHTAPAAVEGTAAVGIPLRIRAAADTRRDIRDIRRLGEAAELVAAGSTDCIPSASAQRTMAEGARGKACRCTSLGRVPPALADRSQQVVEQQGAEADHQVARRVDAVLSVVLVPLEVVPWAPEWVVPCRQNQQATGNWARQEARHSVAGQCSPTDPSSAHPSPSCAQSRSR